MKIKFIFLSLLSFLSCSVFSQYIGVKARYTESRLVEDDPNPPKRENRLILSFFEVSAAGVFTPTTVSNFDLWVYKDGFQYGSLMGGVLDSAGNNYDGYAWTAPKAVAYYNSLGLNYIDCNPNVATHYTVNGHELDCGFVTVSFWETDFDTGNTFEAFPAPNVCLPYYQWPAPYANSPGNVNFSWPVFPTAPYNWYNFSCGGSLQLVIRGVLGRDQGNMVVPLPVRFAYVKAELNGSEKVKVSWSNLTETDILDYIIERSLDGNSFQTIGTVMSVINNGSKSDYQFLTVQLPNRAFYRIKAVEKNGAFYYSPIISLTRNIYSLDYEQSVSIYPNPVTGDNFTFRLSSAPAGRYISSIITPGGQQVKYKLINHQGGDLVKEVDMSGLQSGIYQLVLRSSTKKYTQKLFYVN